MSISLEAVTSMAAKYGYEIDDADDQEITLLRKVPGREMQIYVPLTRNAQAAGFRLEVNTWGLTQSSSFYSELAQALTYVYLARKTLEITHNQTGESYAAGQGEDCLTETFYKHDVRDLAGLDKLIGDIQHSGWDRPFLKRCATAAHPTR